MSDPQEPAEPEKSKDSKGEQPVVDVAQLFGNHREIVLELEGVRYRLRITRRNKLILQK